MLQGLVLVRALCWPPLSTCCTHGAVARDRGAVPLLVLPLEKGAACGNVQAGRALGIPTP